MGLRIVLGVVSTLERCALEAQGTRDERRATSAQERARIIGNFLKKLDNCKESNRSI
jgi:hypothetical protein